HHELGRRLVAVEPNAADNTAVCIDRHTPPTRHPIDGSLMLAYRQPLRGDGRAQRREQAVVCRESCRLRRNRGLERYDTARVDLLLRSGANVRVIDRWVLTL